jgi:hypothetical protein
MLRAGISESGYINSDEVKLFYYTDAILKDEAITLEFLTHVATGQVQMKTKICAMPDDPEISFADYCTLSKEEITGNETEKGEQLLLKETVTPDHNLCFPNDVITENTLVRSGMASCIFVVGLRGRSDYLSHYSLTVEI